MTNTSKSTTLKKKKTTSKPQSTAPSPASADDHWLIAPIAILILACLYYFVTGIATLGYLLTPSFYSVLWFPAFPSLLIALFGMGYIYNTLTARATGKLARVIIRILLIAFLAFLPFAANIIWGGSDANPLLAYVLFGNPFTLMTISILAIAGGVGLIAARSEK